MVRVKHRLRGWLCRASLLAPLLLLQGAGLGCAGFSDSVERLEQIPRQARADERVGYGMRVFSGERRGHDFATQGSDADARQALAMGLQGVPYRYTFEDGDRDPNIQVVAFDAGVAGGVAHTRDILAARGGHRYWMMTRMIAPLAGNMPIPARERVKEGSAYRVLVRADLRETDGPVRARWRCVRHVLEDHYGGRRGTFTGTVYLIAFQPQLIEPVGEDIPPRGNRYLRGLEVRNAAGSHHLDFDGLLVITEHDWDIDDLLGDDVEADEILQELFELTEGAAAN